MKKRTSFQLILVICLIALFANVLPSNARHVKSNREKLNSGEVIVDLKNKGTKKFVIGKVWIPYSIEKVWPIMVNPYEFKSNISPGMTALKVISDKKSESIMEITAKYPIPLPIPPIHYTVKSTYFQSKDSAVAEFTRVSGTLKDFHGYWQAKSVCNGAKTEVVYSMYLEPGFYVPQWIIRRGVSGELPKTLLSLRRRINSIYSTHAKPLTRSITATAALPGAVSSKHL